MKPTPILYSACLLGVKCGFRGQSKTDEKVVALMEESALIPVCPELFGGLPTPRPATERKGDRVITREAEDQTKYYVRGAKEVLRLAKLYGAKKAILKSLSPSCGSGQIYDGSFTGKLISRSGVCAELLQNNGLEVISEEDL